jgi:hypothetical protein
MNIWRNGLFDLQDQIADAVSEALVPWRQITYRVPPKLLPSSRARWKHGLYSAKALAKRKRARELLAQSRQALKQMQDG